MITRYIKGDICETELTYIAHGVNCQNKMGSGVAKALYTKFPTIKTNYHHYNKHFTSAPKELLGSTYRTDFNDKTIYNCYTQLNYGYDGKRYVNYAAIVECFGNFKNWLSGEILAIPKIGAGLAGGDWAIIEQLINDTVGDDLEIWVYYLEEEKSSKRNDLA